MDNQLIRYAFEVRLMDIEGQGIHAYTCVRCNKKELKYFNAKAGGLLCEACGKELKLTRTVSETLIYTLQYIQSADLTKLYAFQLSEEAMAELKYVADRFRGSIYRPRIQIIGNTNHPVKARRIKLYGR